MACNPTITKKCSRIYKENDEEKVTRLLNEIESKKDEIKRLRILVREQQREMKVNRILIDYLEGMVRRIRSEQGHLRSRGLRRANGLPPSRNLERVGRQRRNVHRDGSFSRGIRDIENLEDETEYEDDACYFQIEN